MKSKRSLGEKLGRLPGGLHRLVTGKPLEGPIWTSTIRHDHEFIFVHIPKTAGTSIHTALGDLPRKPFEGRRRSQKIHKHTRAAEIRRVVGDDVWSRYFVFAFVRNPWDLMASSYRWWLEKADRFPELAEHRQAIGEMEGFSAFLKSHYGREWINEFQGNMLDWLEGEGRDEGRIIVDFVGRVETIDADWRTICERGNLPFRPLPHENITQRGSYRDLYDDEARALVAERFAREIARFGYEF